MKKLFGVMILATLPVACGSLPSAPDAVTTTPATSDATVSALALRQPTPVPTPGACLPQGTSILGIQITTVESGEGYAKLRAEAIGSSDDSPLPCFTPVWRSSNPREATIKVGRDPQVAILSGTPGAYQVTAAFGDVVGTVFVKF